MNVTIVAIRKDPDQTTIKQELLKTISKAPSHRRLYWNNSYWIWCDNLSGTSYLIPQFLSVLAYNEPHNDFLAVPDPHLQNYWHIFKTIVNRDGDYKARVHGLYLYQTQGAT